MRTKLTVLLNIKPSITSFYYHYVKLLPHVVLKFGIAPYLDTYGLLNRWSRLEEANHKYIIILTRHG